MQEKERFKGNFCNSKDIVVKEKLPEEETVRNTKLWPVSFLHIICFNILLTFVFNCFLSSLEHIPLINFLSMKGRHQSWAHIPSQQQQWFSLIVLLETSHHYSAFSSLYVIPINQSATLDLTSSRHSITTSLRLTSFFRFRIGCPTYILYSQIYLLSYMEEDRIIWTGSSLQGDPAFSVSDLYSSF